MNMFEVSYPKRSPTEVCWEDIGTDDHSVQFYVDSQSFLDALEGFASAGLRRGETVVVIATAQHRAGLERKLVRRGYNLEHARLANRFITVDAEASLNQFFDGNTIDRGKFEAWAGALIAQGRENSPHVRAFGEMVAILWAQGHHDATIELEALWNEFCVRENLCLFCAYPRSSFAGAHAASMQTICTHHARVIPD